MLVKNLIQRFEELIIHGLGSKPPKMRKHNFLCPTILYIQVLSVTPMKLLLNIYIKYVHKFLLSFVQHFPSYLFFFNNTWN